MIEFRFFGRFNPRLNGPDSSDNSGEITEQVAKDRYFDRAARLDIVPPEDPVTGRVPYKLLVATGAQPGFTVYSFDESGLPILEQRWAAQPDGRLFLLQMIVRRYDLRPWAPTIERSSNGWDSQVVLDMNQDGHTYVQVLERENGRALPGQMTAEMQIDPVLLFRDPPAWGAWDELLESPIDLGELDLSAGR